MKGASPSHAHEDFQDSFRSWLLYYCTVVPEQKSRGLRKNRELPFIVPRSGRKWGPLEGAVCIVSSKSRNSKPNIDLMVEAHFPIVSIESNERKEASC